MSENPFKAPTAVSEITSTERPSFWRALGRGFFWGGLVGLGLHLGIATAAYFIAYIRDGESIPNFRQQLVSATPGMVMLGVLIGSLVGAIKRWRTS